MVDDFIARKHGQDRGQVRAAAARADPVATPTASSPTRNRSCASRACWPASRWARPTCCARRWARRTPKVMAKQRDALRGRRRGQAASTRRRPTKIFDLMEFFAGYGFNKSHSTTYALLAYQTAYLKANYPWHFMAALLTIEAQNTDKLAMYLGECRERGVPVLPPDINAQRAGVHGRAPTACGSASAPSRTSARARSLSMLAVAQAARPHRLALRALRGPRPAPRQQARAREPGQGRRARRAATPGADAAARSRRARLFAAVDRALEHGGRHQRDREQGQSQLFGGTPEDADDASAGRPAAGRAARGPRASSWPARRRRSGST